MKTKIIIFLAVLIAVGLGIGIQQLSPPWIPIKQVECSLDGQNCPQGLEQVVQSLVGTSFLFAPLEKYLQTPAAQLYQLNEMKKIWPAKVEVSFNLKNATYDLQLADETQYVVADTGFAQQITNHPSLTKITNRYWTKPVMTQQVNPDLHQLAIRLKNNLEKNKISCRDIIIHHPDKIELVLKPDLRAMAEQNQLETQLTRLAIVLSELDLNAVDINIKEIDLRFKLPVLRTYQSNF